MRDHATTGPTPPAPAGFVGLTEIAERFHVDERQVSSWRFAGDLPAPDRMRDGWPLWRQETIDAVVAGERLGPRKGVTAFAIAAALVRYDERVAAGLEREWPELTAEQTDQVAELLGPETCAALAAGGP